jgi:hypothetical protein
MAGTQKYPGASTAYFYQNRYGGDLMDVNVVVLHTTEGRSLPDYGGGASAPNLTAVPDLAARKLKWFQHFDIDRSSRALVNAAGGVETNTLNVGQVELVGTCDPATHKKWAAAGYAHIYWPEAPDWALNEVAAFLRWMNSEHDVPLVGPTRWPAYPTSYANGGGQRFTFTQWDAFKGVCGHMHVPENVHGDPGAIDFPKLIAYAKGAPLEEDPMAGITKQDIYDAVWELDQVAAPDSAPDRTTNPTWQPQSYLKDIGNRVRSMDARLAAQSAAITALAGKLGEDVDTGQVVAAVQQAIADAVIRVSVDVNTKES